MKKKEDSKEERILGRIVCSVCGWEIKKTGLVEYTTGLVGHTLKAVCDKHNKLIK